MNKYKILTICLGTLFSINCGGTTTNIAVNTTANSSAANNSSTANKNANAPVNAASPNAAPTAEKPAAVSFGGDWDSEKYNVKGKNYTQLSLRIKQTGENVSGTYSVVDYVGDEPQVEDGNQTPFVGTIKDGVATIKFDQNATVPGYEENVKYAEPETGKPSTATLTQSGESLQWKMGTTGNDTPFEMPPSVKLNKFKPPTKK